MTIPCTSAFTRAELDGQHSAELPARDLFVTLTVLGLPLAGVAGLDANVDTSGPNWLFGSVGNV